ncbi:MAG: SAM-dependent methyltransferase [Thalassobius sp.]|nr:SAM-dependent methyltransferase [Thalassovita sp.]
MKKFLLPAAVALSCTFSACKHDTQSHGEHHKAEQDSSAHSHGKANEYMHQSNLDELVERFESPERDAYQQPQKVMEYLGDISSEKIMDLGAGTGYFTFKLADAGAEVIAADVDDKFQQYIKHKKKELNYSDDQISLRKIPYDDPLLETGEVDKVLLVNTYHHIENRVDYFAKVLKGLSDGGELIIIDFIEGDLPVGPPADHKVDKSDIIEELKKAGFTNFDVNDDLLEYQFIIKTN